MPGLVPGHNKGVSMTGQNVYDVFTIPKSKRRRKTKRSPVQASPQKRLAMALEAKALGLSLSEYAEIIGYEPIPTRVDTKGIELPQEQIFCCEESSQNDGEDD